METLYVLIIAAIFNGQADVALLMSVPLKFDECIAFSEQEELGIREIRTLPEGLAYTVMCVPVHVR